MDVSLWQAAYMAYREVFEPLPIAELEVRRGELARALVQLKGDSWPGP